MKVSKLQNILNHFETKFKPEHKDVLLEDCRNAKSLERAIELAALCKDSYGKKHPHQYRLKHTTLEEVATKLLQKKKAISKAQTFDELYKCIKETPVKGFGDLTKYDVALRIGHYRDLFPTKVYLHAGTRIGAENLLGKIKKDSLEILEFPEAFRKLNLSAELIEDILCIYKDRMKS